MNYHQKACKIHKAGSMDTMSLNVLNAILILLLAAIQASNTAYTCSKDRALSGNIVEYGNLELKFFHERKTFKEAALRCRAWGGSTGRLVNIKTLEMQKRINCHLRNMRMDKISRQWMMESRYALGFHVGAMRSSSGEWKWSDTTRVNLRGDSGWQRWGAVEPNNYRGREHCMSVLITRTRGMMQGYHTGSWIDNYCGSKKFFICQREKNENKCNLRQRVLPFKYADCNADRISKDRHMEIREWLQEPGTQWNMTNTGNDVEIYAHPWGSLRTVVQVQGEVTELVVSKLKIKWGTHHRVGSEHTMGSFSYAGEVQIFHEHHSILGSHVFSFFIKERHNPPNAGWSSLMDAVHNLVEISSIHRLFSPPNIASLLNGDKHSSHRVDLKYRVGQYIRYDGTTSEKPCTPYTWTVYERPLYLSTSQMQELRNIDKFSSSPAKRRKHASPDLSIRRCRLRKVAPLF